MNIQYNDDGTTESTPSITSMTDALIKPVIVREKTFTGCNAKRACYSITHSNIRDVAKNVLIKVKIEGTVNQDSVKDAGSFSV